MISWTGFFCLFSPFSPLPLPRGGGEGRREGALSFHAGGVMDRWSHCKHVGKPIPRQNCKNSSAWTRLTMARVATAAAPLVVEWMLHVVDSFSFSFFKRNKRGVGAGGEEGLRFFFLSRGLQDEGSFVREHRLGSGRRRRRSFPNQASPREVSDSRGDSNHSRGSVPGTYISSSSSSSSSFSFSSPPTTEIPPPPSPRGGKTQDLFISLPCLLALCSQRPPTPCTNEERSITTVPMVG